MDNDSSIDTHRHWSAAQWDAEEADHDEYGVKVPWK